MHAHTYARTHACTHIRTHAGMHELTHTHIATAQHADIRTYLRCAEVKVPLWSDEHALGYGP